MLHALVCPTLLRWLAATSLALTLSFGARAAAQTGVSNDRVSLPAGPGSLEGIGENVEASEAMGVMTYHVSFHVPEGFAGATPDLGLTYDSGQGGSVVGMGFRFDTPFIERMTYRGLPRYDRNDDFAADGAGQLVPIPGSDVFRARDEGAFVRYHFVDAGMGAEGYWTAEYPDGSVGYFGADKSGRLVPNARVGGPDGTFRYHLVDKVDVFGHVLHYSYVKDGAVSLPSRVQYVFVAGQPTYYVTFEYEPRSDETGFDFLVDGKGGFEETLTQRLRTVTAFSRNVPVRRYELAYESYAASGGFTRLSSVKTYGADGGLYPANETFTYSEALGGVCDVGECAEPFMVDMGATGADVETGRATLIDLNGDSLPDLVSTPLSGSHEIFLSEPADDGSTQFAERAFSTVGDASFSLGTGVVQVLDVDGDGRSDLLNTRSGQYLRNDGSGDWTGPLSLEVADTPDFESDFDPSEEGGQRALRFLDYDNDKRIDIIRSSAVDTMIFRNEGPQGFVVDPDVAPIGLGFEEDDLDLADMNGDGLLDPVRLAPDQLTFRLNLGWGRWSAERVIEHLPISTSDVDSKLARLEDINGDALCDLVVVSGSEVKFAINRNGESFLPAVTLTSDDVRGDIPALVDQTVLVADMNGSGSADIVWVDPSGNLKFLDLFPVRPNLVSRITNGLGKVTEIQYGTSVAHMARDGGPGAWSHRLPHPMVVVDRIDTFEERTLLHEVSEHRYHDGYYDPQDRQFRGYARTERRLLGDPSQEEGLTVEHFDVGDEDRYFKGKRLYERLESGGRVLSETTFEYDDCTVAEVPSQTALPVRFVCPVSEQTVVREGLEAAQWVTSRSEFTHDGYGNVVRHLAHGITSRGGGACAPCDRADDVFGAPCGTQCLGDEQYQEASFVPPGSATAGRWMLHAAYLTRRYGRAGGEVASERQLFYDGDAFEGMAQGQLTLGLVSRVTERVDAAGTRISSERHRYDAHGMVVESLDPLGAPGMNGHRRTYAYDRENLRVVRTELALEDGAGPYVLRQDVRHEPRFDQPSRATEWLLVADGAVASEPRSTSYVYDEHGRIVALSRPGDDPTHATQVYRYELGAPTSRIVIESRSTRGGALDLEQVRCLDGRGRTFQTRVRVQPGAYQVDGYREFNVHGEVVRAYQPYRADGSACDVAPPARGLFSSREYDAAHRLVAETLPDGDLYGTPSRLETHYEPFVTRHYDPEDTDPKSAHFQTPSSEESDGLGRTVAHVRQLMAGQEERVEVRFDALGHVRGYIDPQGNEKEQRFDLLGRVVELTDPNAGGTTTFAYDAAGNLVARTDARGRTTRMRFDGANRPLESFEEGREKESKVRWTYDRQTTCAGCTFGEGRLLEVRYPLAPLAGEGSERLGYDERGRLVRKDVELEGHTFTLGRRYDNADRLLDATYPDGDAVGYVYDDASRLTAIPGLLDAVHYDERGLLARVVNAAGTTTLRTYDPRMRLSSLTTETPGNAQVLEGAAYERDRVGNLTRVTDRSTVALMAPGDRTYTYDAWYRPVDVSLGDERISYQHDTLDNVLARTSSLGELSPEHRGAYSYDPARPNAVVQLGTTTYDYDPAGNVTRRGGLALAWDHLGRLTSTRREGEDESLYVYGAGQVRRMKREGGHVTHYLAPDFELRDGIATRYVRVGAVRVARIEHPESALTLFRDLSQDGKIGVADAWLTGHRDDVQDVGRVLASAARRLLVEARPRRTFLHGDHLGSITLATGPQGEPLGQRSFYATGAELAHGVGFVDRYGFTGQERDDGSALLHFAFRYLDTDSARWTSIDPLFAVADADGLGRWGEATGAYGYVAGAWDNAVDPTGLKTMRERFGGFLSTIRTAALRTGDAARGLGARNRPKYIYRGAGPGQQPEDVARDGFRPPEKHERVSLWTHVKKKGGKPFNWTSLSRDPDQAALFAGHYGAGGYIYRVKNVPYAVDVNRAFPGGAYRSQQEFAARDGVSRRHILGYVSAEEYVIGGGDNQPWRPLPEPGPPPHE